MASAWTEEEKAQVIEMYEERNPTEETTVDILTEVAEEVGKTPNSVRAILSRAGVYVKKTPSTPAKASSSEGGSKRVSKADAIAELTNAIEARGLEVNEEILSKLTGKAAVYFTSILQPQDEE